MNAQNQVDYVVINPSLVMDGFYEFCPALEAEASAKTGRVTVKQLKGNINQNAFWHVDAYCKQDAACLEYCPLPTDCPTVCGYAQTIPCSCGC